MALASKAVSEILSAIANAIADDDRDFLLGLHIFTKDHARKGRNSSRKPTPESALAKNNLIDEESIVEVFSNFPDREKLEMFIKSKDFKRIDLVYIARILKVAINRSDDLEVIINKIIDATLGYKLRSQAVRGKS